MSGWPPGGEALNVEPVAGQMPASVILPGERVPIAYRYLVEQDTPNDRHHHLYDGDDPALAQAAFVAAVSNEVEYVTIEAIRERRPT